jgi:EAL domain-containing protein (putative c-di-GMP-specific phosphodiesterase class I)
VASALRLTGANPHNLIIELTESTIVDNLDAVASTLDELRNLGVRAAIDDFGTGYCGLRYLSVLPVAALKIDRSFIQGMTPSDAAIVGATIAMGHSLGLSIIAEGVETEDQRRFLADQGCDRLQGYLLGRPMPAEALVDLLRAERAAMLQGPWDPSSLLATDPQRGVAEGHVAPVPVEAAPPVPASALLPH